MNTRIKTPPAVNEPVRDYAPGSPERASLEATLDALAGEELEIPMVIGGERVGTGDLGLCRMPHRHGHVLARYHKAGQAEIRKAVDAAMEARPAWAAMPWRARAAILLKAADLLAGPYRDRVNAATMLGQSKTCHQAEIDSACELVDFWRFGPAFAEAIYAQQPASAPGTWNMVDHRPLDGFVFAVTPFNFTSIAGNLPTAPALMGNTVVWKPASTAVYSAHFVMQVLEEAGMPPGVINLVLGSGRAVGDIVLSDPRLAGVHFTGSTAVFQQMWRTIGESIETYRQYPRIVGETGGKDFVFVHASADVEAVATAILRGGFEYQGQKCSAASRIYVPDSRWKALRRALLEQLAEVRMGDIRDFSNFMGAVIDEAAFRNIALYIDYAKDHAGYRVVYGGGRDESTGYFIEPTLIETDDPRGKLMTEEIFGPVVTVYVYPEAAFEETLDLCDGTSPYALTGSIFARDRQAILTATDRLRFAAGNFYINDKPTGAVVNQQPFGGGRASGTNDKAGSPANLMRWVSPRSIKETFVPPRHFGYPFLG